MKTQDAKTAGVQSNLPEVVTANATNEAIWWMAWHIQWDLNNTKTENEEWRNRASSICEALMKGDRTPDVASYLDYALFRAGVEWRVRQVGKAIVDELSRPSVPSLLSVRTVAHLLKVKPPTLERYARQVVCVPSDGWGIVCSGNQMLFDAAKTETHLRRHYTGSPGKLPNKSLLLAIKYDIKLAASSLTMPRGLLRSMVKSGDVPAIRLGKHTYRLLSSDMEPLKGQWPRVESSLRDAGIEGMVLKALNLLATQSRPRKSRKAAPLGRSGCAA